MIYCKKSAQNCISGKLLSLFKRGPFKREIGRTLIRLETEKAISDPFVRNAGATRWRGRNFLAHAVTNDCGRWR